MCGIVGYTGPKNAYNEVYRGLVGLEYRGYDSCGIAVLDESSGHLHIEKEIGPPSLSLPKTIAKINSTGESEGGTAIGHTRWATHGEVTIENTHPHESTDGKFQLVHNGIIENHSELKAMLLHEEHCSFYSHTDSEVLVNLISYYCDKLGSLESGISKALSKVEGTFGIGVICSDRPELLIAARRGSPISIGLNEDGNYLSSDPSVFSDDLSGVVNLDDNRIAWITKENVRVQDFYQSEIPLEIRELKAKESCSPLGQHSSYMEKEIFEQPDSIRRAIRGRLKNGKIKIPAIEGIYPEKILIIGCGTSYHAGLLGKYYFEDISGIPTEVEIASEFNYRSVPKEENVLAIFMSQSGETADTITSLLKCKGLGYDLFTITNSVCSTLAREAGKGIYQYAGKEVSVASTKAFTSQATILLMMACYLGKTEADWISKIPELTREVLRGDEIDNLIDSLQSLDGIVFLGRQSMYPVALEASLKLKEVSYINSQAYPSGEIKHGPLALVTEDTPVILFAAQNNLEKKNSSTGSEVSSRGGRVVIVRKPHQQISGEKIAEVIIPKCNDYVAPILSVICFQLFALRVASRKNVNIDKPRNLAKSVTVE
jgi:glucosamine--fructose-6-phosphate aminotransferase (isomerizing)